MKAVSTLAQGQSRRVALAILPLALLLTAMGGFALRPQLSIEAAQALHRTKEARVAEYEAERSALDEFKADGGYERLAQALDRARRIVPQGTTELELHSAVRMAAAACGFELTQVSIADAEDPGFALLDDMVVMHLINLRGEGTLASLPRLVSALRTIGYPTSVLEFTAASTKTLTPRYRWQAAVGVFASTDVPDHLLGGRGPEGEGSQMARGESQ